MINTSEKPQLNRSLKAILNYCFRVFIFLLLSRHIIYQYLETFIYPPLSNWINSLNLDPFVDVGLFALSAILIHDYLFAKICGLFKKLDGLNTILSIIVIILVDIIRGYSLGLNIQLIPLKFTYDEPEFLLTLILAFILYKFCNLITKIFPVPFKQIGYIFSIELLKDIYKDVKQDINENYLKKGKRSDNDK